MLTDFGEVQVTLLSPTYNEQHNLLPHSEIVIIIITRLWWTPEIRRFLWFLNHTQKPQMSTNSYGSFWFQVDGRKRLAHWKLQYRIFSWTEMNKYFEQKNFEPFAMFNVCASFRATRSETSNDLNHNKYDENNRKTSNFMSKTLLSININ